MEGERLGSYVLLERVARGGMAEVWRARDADGRVVCIKRLDPSLRGDVDFIEMFRDEAALVLDLDHENIVKMKELIDTDDELAQVMEFVDGPSLARLRASLEADGGFSVAESLQIAVYLARALHHAHTRTRDGEVGGAPLTIVHRDVSPQNILVDKKGRVKLVDFGIAKAAQRLTRTQAGTLKGKLSYMAPEQARGGPLDHRADQFAAGIILWEMLTGRRLFGGRNELLILEQVQKSDPVPPSSVKRGIPKSVDRAVLRALRWHPEERFADMLAFERALQACLVEVAPVGFVDLAPSVERALAHEPVEKTAAKQMQGAQRTRVISADDTSQNDPTSSATASDSSSAESSSDSSSNEREPLPVRNPFETNPLAQPEHTGDFFKKRPPITPSTALAGGVGVVAVVGVVSLAVWFAERDPVGDKPLPIAAPFTDLAGAKAYAPKAATTLAACRDPCSKRVVDDEKKRDGFHYADAAALDYCLVQCAVPGAGRFEPPGADVLEAELEKASAHPCRTELLDDLLDKTPMSVLGRSALADAVETCVSVATEAPKLRASLKPGALDEPPWPPPKPKHVKHPKPPSTSAHAAELERRGQLALAVGEYGAAKTLLASALSFEPSHVDDHALLAQAFRGLGDPAGAGYHLRMWLYAHPDAPDGERAVHYLKRYSQPTELHLSSAPAPDEKAVRIARYVHDADNNASASDAAKMLEQARDLAPTDAHVLLKLGEAYTKAGRNDDAKKAYKAALADANASQSRAIKEKLAKLGS